MLKGDEKGPSDDVPGAKIVKGFTAVKAVAQKYVLPKPSKSSQ